MPYYLSPCVDSDQHDPLCLQYPEFDLFNALLAVKPVWDKETQPTFPEWPPKGITQNQARQFRAAEARARGETVITFDQIDKSFGTKIGGLLKAFIRSASASLRKSKPYECDLPDEDSTPVSDADVALGLTVKPPLTRQQLTLIRNYDAELDRILRSNCSPMAGCVPYFKFEAFDGWRVVPTECHIIGDELTRLLNLDHGDLLSNLSETAEGKEVNLDLSTVGNIRSDTERWRDFHFFAAECDGYTIT